jgi:hypothetical protein
MKNFTGWIFLGAVVALYTVACSPTNESYPKNSATSSGSSSASANANKQSSDTSNSDPQSQVSGDWICKSGETCSYSLISISKDGSATALASLASSNCEFQHDAKVAVTPESKQDAKLLHVELAVFESGSVVGSGSCDAGSVELSKSASMLSADIPASNDVSELKLSDGSDYIKK